MPSDHSSRIRHAPLVSLIVPIYNVERFLDEALESIREQDDARLEIVCIDDGSTDASADILAAHARADRRILAHRQPNAGLGAARNAGLHFASGDLIMFVDADDRLPTDAVSQLQSSLERTGSDFSVGKIRRFDERRTWNSALTTSVFDVRLDRTHISAHPQLVYDTVAVNKLFRKTFLDRISFAFPLGVAFEDMELITRAHLAAEAIDVVPKVVYEWRERPESISSNRFKPASFDDRIAALENIHTIVFDSGLENVQRAFLSKLLNFDQMIYAKAICPGDHEQLQAFTDGYGGLVNHWAAQSVASSATGLPKAIALAARRGDVQALQPLMRLASPDPGIDRFYSAFGQHPGLTAQRALRLGARRIANWLGAPQARSPHP